MNHIWIQNSYSSPYEAHLQKQRVTCVKKERLSVISQRVIIKMTETAHCAMHITNMHRAYDQTGEYTY